MRRARGHSGNSSETTSPNGQTPLKSYKTSLCNKFVQLGTCDRGEKCCFAHGIDDLRQRVRPPNFKTQLCRNMAQTASCPYGDKCDFIHCVGQNSSRTSTSTRSIDDCSANDNAHLLAKNADYHQQLENLVCALGPARIEQILHKAGPQTPFPLSTPSSPDTPSQSLPLTPAQGMQHSQIPESYAGIVPQEPFMSNRNDSYPGPFHSHSWDTNRYGQLLPQPCFPPYSPLHKFAVGKHVSAFSPLPAPPQRHLEEPVHPLGPSLAYRHLERFGSLDDPLCSPENAIHSQDTLAERLAKLDLTKFNKFY